MNQSRLLEEAKLTEIHKRQVNADVFDVLESMELVAKGNHRSLYDYPLLVVSKNQTQEEISSLETKIDESQRHHIHMKRKGRAASAVISIL